MNFTAAELRAMVPRVSVASFAEIALIQAMLREYAALKEAAESGVSNRLGRNLTNALVDQCGTMILTVMNESDASAALLAVAPLLALMNKETP